MGFPKDFTLHACSKSVRKSQPTHADDIRMSLIGNSWHVGVVCLLLHDLLVDLQLIKSVSVQHLVDSLRPGSSTELSRFLFRPAFIARRPFAKVVDTPTDQQNLADRLSFMVSPKGSDVMLSASTEPLPNAHRFRTSVPAALWQWETICSWGWRSRSTERINKLEIRALYTGLKWRIARQKVTGSKIHHLIDSMVSLQILNKGRTSSRRLRNITRKISALLVSARLFLILSYVATDKNPADRPSRRPVRKKWLKGNRYSKATIRRKERGAEKSLAHYRD